MSVVTMTTYAQSIENVKARLAELRASVADASSAARSELARLLALPVGQRQDSLQLANLPLAWSLLDESRSRFVSAPDECWELASLSLEVCDRVRSGTAPGEPDHRLVIDPALVAHAHQANVLRIREDYAAADSLFASVIREVPESSGDPAMVAEIFFLLASLRKDQCRNRESIACARRAASLYREIGDTDNLALSLVKVALVQYRECETEAALEVLKEAEAVGAAEDGELPNLLYFTVQHNRALLHVDRGEIELARSAITPRQEELYRSSGARGIELGLTVEGLILSITPAASRTELLRVRSRSLELLGAVRDRRGREGKIQDMVLYTLHMMAVYLDLDEPEAVAALLAEIEPLLSRSDLHTEALASLALLRDAFQADALSAQALRMWQMYLRRVPFT